MSIEALNNENENFLYENKKELKKLKKQIEKEDKKEQKKLNKMKEKKDNETTDSIEACIIYDDFLKNVAEIQISENPKEKIKEIKESFTKNGVIIYQDATWLVKEIKDIEGFLNKVASWEITIDYLIDTEQYSNKWTITLDKKEKHGIVYTKIKKIQLNAKI